MPLFLREKYIPMDTNQQTKEKRIQLFNELCNSEITVRSISYSFKRIYIILVL